MPPGVQAVWPRQDFQENVQEKKGLMMAKKRSKKKARRSPPPMQAARQSIPGLSMPHGVSPNPAYPWFPSAFPAPTQNPPTGTGVGGAGPRIPWLQGPGPHGEEWYIPEMSNPNDGDTGTGSGSPQHGTDPNQGPPLMPTPGLGGGAGGGGWDPTPEYNSANEGPRGGAKPKAKKKAKKKVTKKSKKTVSRGRSGGKGRGRSRSRGGK